MKIFANKSPSTILAAVGAGFLVIAVYFLVRDTAVPPEIVLTAVAVLASVAAALGRPRRWPALAPGALLVLALVSGGWYLAITSPAVLPALIVTAIGAGAAVALRGREHSPPGSPVAGQLAWYAAGVSFLAATGALSFHVLTSGMGEESVVARLIPTMAWLAAGLALIVAARNRSSAPGRVGTGLAAIALTKTLVYDSVHLQGPLRVTMFAAVGALLLAGARLVGSAGPREDASARDGEVLW
jgi:hypothetical protein